MPSLVILGSASAVRDAEHANTHMALRGDYSTVLIDAPGETMLRLLDARIEPDELSDLILTHFHPDHISGVPNLLMSSWLTGRVAPLRIYGLHHCLQRMEDLMMAFHWDEWTGFFPVAFHHLPEREGMLVLDNEDFAITASPVRHYVPTIGLRIVVKETNFVLAYSADTIPCQEAVSLARGADLLIHEATGDEPLGHSSARQAGEVAAEAGVRRLGLIHYNVWGADPAGLVAEASSAFVGPVFLCEDFQEIDLQLP